MKSELVIIYIIDADMAGLGTGESSGVCGQWMTTAFNSSYDYFMVFRMPQPLIPSTLTQCQLFKGCSSLISQNYGLGYAFYTAM